MTIKNITSSKGKFIMRVGQTAAELKYRCPRQAVKISHPPKINRIKTKV
ncbi:MAG: hypothetical protein NC923_06535 [Candidatus Omnitrophica bacterium]|nr:hypothetical protein [Candidatus Omnitrophota bacterium]